MPDLARFPPIGRKPDHWAALLGERPFFYGGEGRRGARVAQAVVLLSGGLDSMVCAALARERGFSVVALTVDYNQRHRVEIESARRIARAIGAERHVKIGRAHV